MALTISQAQAASYPAVLAAKRKAVNQWGDASFLNELDAQGGVEAVDFGPTLEVPIDYRRNQGGTFLSNELQQLAATKTEVISAASYSPAELAVPIIWSNRDEVTNPTDNQKINLVASLNANAIDSHDDLIEQALFATSTNGFLGLLTHIPDNGQSSDGGIDSTTEAFWRSINATYVDDTDILAALTSAYNSASKGSGSSSKPTLLVSDGATQAIFEGTQQPLQRWDSGSEANVGFKRLKFKNANYVYSQYGGTRIYGLNPKAFKLRVAKGYFRKMDPARSLESQPGNGARVYSAVQTVVEARSRLFVVKL